jgi:hypothetical protein
MRLSFIFQYLIGVSDLFWDVVVVSTHTSTFLTSDMNSLPAYLLPVLEDMVSVSRSAFSKSLLISISSQIFSGGTMSAWEETTEQVFAAMTSGFHERVHTLRSLFFDRLNFARSVQEIPRVHMRPK